MYNLVDLTNKHILITGASSGIGREVAITASKLGAKLSLIGRDTEKLKSVSAQLDGSGHLYYEYDITNLENIDQLVLKIVETSGKIDGFVHSAGVEMTRPIKMLKPNHYIDTYITNTVSALEFTKYITKINSISEEASLIYVSSIVGRFGQSGKTAYSASKGGLIAAAKCLALELAPRKIRVNTVLPAVVQTDMSNKILESLSTENVNSILSMHPLGFGQPKDVANAIVFLLSSASNWVTGTEFIIDGGYSCA